MTTSRARRRQRRNEQQLRLVIIIGGALILIVAGIFIALRVATPDYGRLPRANRVSAANLEPGAGKDICALFPKRTGTETQRPALVIDRGKDYAAWLQTRNGVVAIDLFANIAPETVNNFMYLACNKFYDGLTFHRVIPSFMAQGGDPKGDGTGGPGYTIPDEFGTSDLTFDQPGLVSMAHTNAPNSAGSQFFITYGPTPNLNGSFTIFGQVVKGMEVVQVITPHDPLFPTVRGDTIVSIIVRQVSP